MIAQENPNEDIKENVISDLQQYLFLKVQIHEGKTILPYFAES